ncbi:MAG: permease, partial [Planctomycetia bacterium]|nr:permease [Planctomycetia bacterium]
MEDLIRNFIVYFTSILYEAMPFVVLGATIAGILEELTPRQSFAFMMGVSAFLLTVIFVPRSVVGAAFGPGAVIDPSFLWIKIGAAALLALAVTASLLQLGSSIDSALAGIGRWPILAIAASGLLGLIMPMCECGIVPVIRRLLRKGMPLSCCTCYLLAGPIVNIVVLLSTYMAFAGMEEAVDSSGAPARQIGGLGMVLLRGGLGWLVAFVTSLVVLRQYRRYGDELLTPLARPPQQLAATDDAPPAPRSLLQRLGNISETALHDFVDIMVFLILGALLSAGARIMIPNSTFEALSSNAPALAILGMMALAIVLCLCSEADAFLAASLTALRPAPKLAFLVLGPMMDFKLYMMYLRVFRPRLIWTIIPCVVV